VQDTKRLAIDNGHNQNQRSPTGAVSPGLRDLAVGTTDVTRSRPAAMQPAIAGATTGGGYETVTPRINRVL